MRQGARPLGRGIPDPVRLVGRTALTDVSFGETTITREVMQPGWRWSDDMRPVVGTALCLATHRLYIVSGRMHVVTADADLEVGAGDALVIAPGHDAWTVGEEPCEIVDFSAEYSDLLTRGGTHHRSAGPARIGRRESQRVPGPAGLTPRETEVLALIATGATAKQVARLLGIAPKTVATHIERIYTKTAVTSRAAATRYAIHHGLVDPVC